MKRPKHLQIPSIDHAWPALDAKEGVSRCSIYFDSSFH